MFFSGHSTILGLDNDMGDADVFGEACDYLEMKTGTIFGMANIQTAASMTAEA